MTNALRLVVMNLKSDLSDSELLRMMLAGDEESLSVLYRRRQGGIYRFALQMSGSKSIAEDVTQEVFLFLMRQGHIFDAARGALSAFLLGVARNYVLRRLRVEHLLSPLADDNEDAREPLGSRARRDDRRLRPVSDRTGKKGIKSASRPVGPRLLFLE